MSKYTKKNVKLRQLPSQNYIAFYIITKSKCILYALIGQSAMVYCASKAYGNFKHHLNCYMQAIDHKFLWFRGMIALEEFINHLPTPCDLWIFSTNWGGYKSAEFGTNQIKRWFFRRGEIPITQGKSLGAERRTNKGNPHIMQSLGMEPEGHTAGRQELWPLHQPFSGG